MHNIDTECLSRLLERQKASWSTVADNYAALEQVMTKRIILPGCNVTAMHNPARILSTASKPGKSNPDAGSCFLCAEKRPAEQEGIPFAGRYSILVNPYPIFKRHYTIAALTHTEQRIEGRFGDMLRLSVRLNGLTVFYNGAECGASAPHHAHFQAGESGVMPIEYEWRSAAEIVAGNNSGEIYRLSESLRNAFVIESGNADYVEESFGNICAAARHGHDKGEPMMNVLARYVDERWTVFVFLRKKHRPSFYGSDGEGRMLVSPASVEMGGLLILPRREDFVKITAAIVTELYNEVCIDNGEADGIVSKLKKKTV